MKLLTKEILKKLPPIYANEGKSLEETKVIVKFFYPVGGATWYATEFDPEQGLFFGFVNLGDDEMAEMGYFSLKELENLRMGGFLSLKIERDKCWNSSTSLSDVINFKVR